jgi:hypothetical protein
MCISLSLLSGVMGGNAVVFIISLFSILNKQMGQIMRPPESSVPLYFFNGGFAPEPGAPPEPDFAPDPGAPSGDSWSWSTFFVLFLIKNVKYSL